MRDYSGELMANRVDAGYDPIPETRVAVVWVAGLVAVWSTRGLRSEINLWFNPRADDKEAPGADHGAYDHY